MTTFICKHCGAKVALPFSAFTRRTTCDACWSRLGYGAPHKRSVADEAWKLSKPVDTATLMYARVKPANTSATRWRMELARRANPWRFALAGGM